MILGHYLYELAAQRALLLPLSRHGCIQSYDCGLGGSRRRINTRRKEWRKTKGQYLFNGKNLGKVYRAKMLKALNEAGLLTTQLQQALPREWIVNCQHTGQGLPALKYLSRYLYKGVISENNILANDKGQVTFSYTDSKTKATKTRTLPGEDFLWLILRHVLPRGFRRVRDYGFLHSNAKKRLKLVRSDWLRHGGVHTAKRADH